MALIQKFLSCKRKKDGNFRAISSTKHTCVPHNLQWQLAPFCLWHGTNPPLLHVFISKPAYHLMLIFCISKSSQCKNAKPLSVFIWCFFWYLNLSTSHNDQQHLATPHAIYLSYNYQLSMILPTSSPLLFFFCGCRRMMAMKIQQ